MPEAALIQTPAVEGAPRHGPAAQILQARLAATPRPRANATDAARTDALDRLSAQGLPGPRHEYRRYTDPAPINAAVPNPVPLDAVSGDPALFAGVDKLRLVFVDGH
ncbi:MAG TPA: Fe-S cluster assembly protein SufD, partial [Paracoccus solventivorans]|nr:Fe-S cluster assembly protein SufD [Paracoccus solventivorans]